MSRYITYNPNQVWLLPPSLREELGERHPAVFVRELVERLDPRRFGYPRALNAVFAQVVEAPRGFGAGTTGRVAIDSTRVPANASPDRSDSLEQLRSERARVRRPGPGAGGLEIAAERASSSDAGASQAGAAARFPHRSRHRSREREPLSAQGAASVRDSRPKSQCRTIVSSWRSIGINGPMIAPVRRPWWRSRSANAVIGPTHPHAFAAIF